MGPWTAATLVHYVAGDPDAVPVGDWHLPGHVGHALAGEPRADDARMLELLEPFRPHRARVWRLIVAGTPAPPTARAARPHHRLAASRSEPPARNQAICASLSVCVHRKSRVAPSGRVIRHRTGRPGRSVGEVEHRDAVVLADLVVGRRDRRTPSGRRPCFFRFVSCNRGKLRAKTTTQPRSRGSIAANSRDEPSP